MPTRPELLLPSLRIGATSALIVSPSLRSFATWERQAKGRDDIPESEEGGMTVHAIFPNQRVLVFMDSIGVLKALLQPRTNIHRFHQRLFIDDIELEEYQRLSEIVNDIEMTLQSRTTSGGGGKRGHGGASSKSREDLARDEEIGNLILRMNAQPNASPAFTELVARPTALIQFAKTEDLQPAQFFGLFQMKGLEGLMNVSATTATFDGRCKKVAEVIFHNS